MAKHSFSQERLRAVAGDVRSAGLSESKSSDADAYHAFIQHHEANPYPLLKRAEIHRKAAKLARRAGFHEYAGHHEAMALKLGARYSVPSKRKGGPLVGSLRRGAPLSEAHWAHEKGYAHGRQAAKYTEVGDEDRREAGCKCKKGGECADCLGQAAYSSNENAKQYAGHVDDLQKDSHWNHYERGVEIGVKHGVAARLKLKPAKKPYGQQVHSSTDADRMLQEARIPEAGKNGLPKPLAFFDLAKVKPVEVEEGEPAAMERHARNIASRIYAKVYRKHIALGRTKKAAHRFAFRASNPTYRERRFPSVEVEEMTHKEWKLKRVKWDSHGKGRGQFAQYSIHPAQHEQGQFMLVGRQNSQPLSWRKGLYPSEQHAKAAAEKHHGSISQRYGKQVVRLLDQGTGGPGFKG